MNCDEYPEGFDEPYRAGFEEWAVKNGYEISRDSSGRYTSPYSQLIWLDWAVDEHYNSLVAQESASTVLAKESKQ